MCGNMHDTDCVYVSDSCVCRSQVAEKRKTLLDDLAIKYQTSTDQHREQTRGLEEGHRAEVDLMSAQIDELQVIHRCNTRR